MSTKANQEDKSPVREYQIILDDSGNPRYVNRLLVATPTRGLVRMEWVSARYGQIIPTNWSMVMMNQFMHGYIPMRYSVPDAQNLIAKAAVEGDFEWLLLIEDDTMPPPDGFIRINDYIAQGDIPVVSGLYFTKSQPSEPLVYRGRGTSFYGDWHLGDKVWCDGVPTGFLLIHCAILRAMWNESEEYLVHDRMPTRRIFETPTKMWWDPEEQEFYSMVGTSDLHWCTRVIDEKFFAKAGWHDFQQKKHPFLVDTNLFCRHIDLDGVQYPSQEEIANWQVQEEDSEKEL